jgi:hypothetical protein
MQSWDVGFMDAGLAVNPLEPISYERTDCERGTIQRCNDDAKNNLVLARFYHVMINQRSILIKIERTWKMFATAQVTETSFILAKAVGIAIPSRTIEFGSGDFGSQKNHQTSTIRNRKRAIIALPGQHSYPRR